MKHALLLAAMASLPAFAADLKFSGFGSLVGAEVLSGDGYVAHYPSMATYDSKFDITEESRLGLQATAVFTDELSTTIQMTSRGSLNWEPDIEWFYLTWQPKTEWRIQAGRMRIPAYLYSDYMDVGFAYNFIRVPGDAYSVDAVNYNGLSATYSHSFGSVDTSFQLYGGREKTEPNVLMSYIRQFEHDRDYTDMYGAVFNLWYRWLNFRLSYLTTDIQEEADPDVVPVFVTPIRTLPNGRVITDDFNIQFYDVAFLLDFNPVSVVVEYNEYEYYTSWLASFAYNMDKWTYHFTASDFELNEAWEAHSTVGVGFRYDVNSNLAFKMQLDRFDDTGENPFTSAPNPICRCADGDVMVLSAGVDFVF